MRGREILTAVDASAQRAKEIGYDEALIELGFEPDQLRKACMQEAHDWIARLPVGATVGDVIGLICSAQIVGVTSGVRLGRMYPPPSDEEAEQ